MHISETTGSTGATWEPVSDLEVFPLEGPARPSTKARAYAHFSAVGFIDSYQEIERRRGVKTDTKMGPVTER